MAEAAVRNGNSSSGVMARIARIALYRWWRKSIVGRVDHERVVERIIDESGWTPRYVFMVMMSAGIAVLGLLLSSPAVVIGAMLISPLMGPILGLGFSLALFDFAEMRQSLRALAIGSSAAIIFCAIIVALSPLQAPTAEIIARTRPNLFDLMVALFAALAGTFAIIRGRGDTIVGVAIATALMPPLATVGYGLATWNLPVLGGAFALFVTNFVTIALAAMVMARFYGFGAYLSPKQGLTQTAVLLGVFIVMAVPLGFSLRQIALEAVTVSQVRTALAERFGPDSRVTQLEVKFDAEPIQVGAVVIAPRTAVQRTADVEASLERLLHQRIDFHLDQVLLDPGAGAIDAQRAELRQARTDVTAAENTQAASLSQMLALVAGVAPDQVTIDRDKRRATVRAAALPGGELATYQVLEERADAMAGGWTVELVPPLARLPEIRFADNVDTLDDAARAAVASSAWAAQRWNVRALSVPGLPAPDVTVDRPNLSQRRGLAVAEALSGAGIRAVAAPAAGQRYRLAPVEGEDAAP